MKRILLGCFVLGVLFFGFQFAGAQVVAPSIDSDSITDAADSNTDSEAPNVRLYGMSLDKSSYSVGDQVTIKFIVENQSNKYVPSVFYRVSLVGGLGNTFEKIYDQVLSPEYSVAPGESRYVSVPYDIPSKIVAKDLSISVESILSNETVVGEVDSPVTITSDISPSVVIKSASIVIGNNTFDTQEGPTVSKETGAKLKLGLMSSGVEVTGTPYVEVFNKKDINTVVLRKSFDSIIVGKDLKIVNLDLPVDLGPGVFIAKLSFIDKNRKSGAISEILPVRYIISGSQGEILSVETDVEQAKVGDVVMVSVGYGGAPYDIASGKIESKEAILKINLLNENDEVVSSSENTVNLSSSADSITIPMEISKDSNAIRAEASILVDGKVIHEFNKVLSANFDKAKTSGLLGMGSLDDKVLLIIVGGVLVLLVLLVIVLGWYKSKNVIGTMILMLGIAVSGLIVASNSNLNNVEAEGDTNLVYSSANGYFSGLGVWKALGLRVTEIPSTVAPGEEFHVKGYTQYAMCNNRTGDVIIKVFMQNPGPNGALSGRRTVPRENGNTYARTVNPASTGDEAHGDDKANLTFTNRFNVKFIAPSTPGTYFIDARGALTVANNGEAQGWANNVKVYKITVANRTDDKCPAPGIQLTLPCPSGNPGDTGGTNDNGDINTNPLTCSEDIWSCGNWSECNIPEGEVRGTQTKSCVKTFECSSVNTPMPDTSQSCFAVSCINQDPITGECPMPDITEFKAVPSLVPKGGSCNLIWKVKGATDCIIEPGIGSVLEDNTDTNEKSGSESTGSLEQTQTYKLKCINGNKEDSKVAQCKVQDTTER